MKDKNKICIIILTALYIFFISIFNVKAESYTEWDGGGYTGWNAWGSLGIPPGAVNYTMQPWFGKFKNRTGGTLMFQLNYTGPFEIYTVEVFRSSASGFTCDLGDHINYTDNNTQMTTMTVKCPIDFWSDGLREIRIHGWLHSDPGCGIYVGEFATYYTDNVSSSDIQNIINTMNSNTQSLINAISQRNSDINDIKNKMNEDISQSDKDSPNQNEYNNAKQQEDNIIQSISNVSPNDITFSQDIQASNKIWDTTTRFLQTHVKVMGLVISILSIGIIKLIMNR